MTQRRLQVFKPPHLLTIPLSNYLRGARGADLSRLLAQFPNDWSTYIMGGLLRNLVLKELRGIPLRNADIDLVVKGADSSHELRHRIGDLCFRKNEFGGAKCRVNPTGDIFDIWRIEDHIGMAVSSKPHTIQQLLRHNLLDVDAILLDLKTETLYDYGCLSATKRGEIGLVGPEGISKHFVAPQVAHVVLIALKTGFELSRDAMEFIRASCESAEIKAEALRIAQRKLSESSPRLEEFLNALLMEEPWPIMTA